MNPKAVIGAGYGDEGKGLITDYLCAKHGGDVVVRFNGGAQAGHTVQLPSGERHIFSHFSAGTFNGAATFLSEFFIVNPMIYFKELAMFDGFVRCVPDVYVDPRAIVTTPYDMLINQLTEDLRGSNRHGSCGLGINETVTRSLSHSLLINFQLLENTSELKKRLEYIRTSWFKDRCRYLGIDPALGQDIIDNDNIFNNFIADAQEMYSNCMIEGPDLLASANQIIFEGAQGLLLDEDYGKFPYVTRSNTGIRNVVSILDDIGLYDEVDITYVTRCYLTRHGAGPLDNELTTLPYKGVVDETNIDNKYQGSLRFAYLDVDQLKKAIEYDLNCETLGIKVNANLAVTCLDQLDNQEAKVIHNGALQTLKGDVYGDVGDMINVMVGLNGPLMKSFGPTRLDVIEK